MLPEPRAAGDRRAVRHARGAAPGPHRPRHRAGARHRPAHGGARCAARRASRSRDLPEQLGELYGFFNGTLPRRPPVPRDHRRARAVATSRRSGCSARATTAPGSPALLGLPFSFAHHFAAANTLPAARGVPAQLPSVGRARRAVRDARRGGPLRRRPRAGGLPEPARRPRVPPAALGSARAVPDARGGGRLPPDPAREGAHPLVVRLAHRRRPRGRSAPTSPPCSTAPAPTSSW